MKFQIEIGIYGYLFTHMGSTSVSGEGLFGVGDGVDKV